MDIEPLGQGAVSFLVTESRSGETLDPHRRIGGLVPRTPIHTFKRQWTPTKPIQPNQSTLTKPHPLTCIDFAMPTALSPTSIGSIEPEERPCA